MPIDNRYYDDLADEWWSLRGRAGVLHEMNPTRTAYFRSAIRQGLGEVRGAKVLDVGCGGGLVSEELAKAGMVVSGLDLSASSIAAAERHAAAHSLQIDYRAGSVFELPYADGSFDAVVSSDFLEHISDRLDDALTEMVRVLRPQGVLAFDTINRTPQSYLLAIVALQRWRKIIPADTHDWRMFIKPDELILALNRHGVQTVEIRGLQPSPPLPLAAANILRHGKVGGFKVGKDTVISYLGWGVKRS